MQVNLVERKGTHCGKRFEETISYLSSLDLDANQFAHRIRDHGQVENQPHWIKNVVLGEDKAPLCAGHALTNFAIARTIAVNSFGLG